MALDHRVFEQPGIFLICTSTYGQGDVPDNAKALYADLLSVAGRILLASDTASSRWVTARTWEHSASAASASTRRLVALGATRLGRGIRAQRERWHASRRRRIGMVSGWIASQQAARRRGRSVSECRLGPAEVMTSTVDSRDQLAAAGRSRGPWPPTLRTSQARTTRVSPPHIHIPRDYNAAVDLVERNLARGRSERIAFIDDANRYTYRELSLRVNRCANAWRRLGMRMEDRVVLLLHDTIDFPVAFLGAIKAGVVPIPCNTLLTAADYEYLLADSRARAVIVSAPLLPMMRNPCRRSCESSST